MIICVNRMWEEEDGILSFEWTLLATVLVIGLVSGIAGVRDAITDEFGDVAQAMLAIDQSYTVDFPLATAVHTADASSGSDSAFTDAAAYTDCTRLNGLNGNFSGPLGQGQLTDSGDGG